MRRVLVAVLALVLLAALGAGCFWFFTEHRLTDFAARPFGTSEPKLVEIPIGTNAHEIATLLARQGVVSDADLLYSWVRREKLSPKLKAGEYEFSGSITPQQAIEKITAAQVKQYHFTVPEGLRVDEILPILAGSELGLSLEKLQQLADTPACVRKSGVPADTLEGFLYPDTYSFPRGTSEETVLKKMVTRTLEEVKKSPRTAELDLLETVTLASIIEKETGSAPERPRISCVFHNRLRLKMRLQTDPTVIYAMMLINGRYSKNITRKDLETEHPYNTYRNKGLPPGPIASPGAAAIHAALNPIECDDLFFVSRNDGTHAFCPDLKCHNENVQKWQAKHEDPQAAE